jgi:polyisoprenoid-binding protein YceI
MAAQNYDIDVSHSGIHFSVRHMMIAKVRGTFAKWSGSITLDESDPSKSSFTASIDVASIDTKDEKRDAHLKSADFFDVEKNPTIIFVSRRVEAKGNDLKVTGDFTLHGITREVSLEVERTGGGKDPWGNARQGFSARGSVDRRDFGLTWNTALETGGVLVGEKVEFEIEVSAVAAAEKKSA